MQNEWLVRCRIFALSTKNDNENENDDVHHIYIYYEEIFC